MKIFNMLKCLLFMTFLISYSHLYGENTDEEAQKLYNDGYKQCINQDWNKAKLRFHKLIDEYPESRYQDDALFWIGYCEEKQGNNIMNAFATFGRLVNNYPSSPWVDDAVMHQIALAEKYNEDDPKFFTDFLERKLSDKNSNFQNQTALALGRLGDKRAIPILSNLKLDDNLGAEAQSLLKTLTGEEYTESQEQSPTTSLKKAPELDILRMETRETYTSGKPEKRHSLFFFSSKRYDQYRSLLKKHDSWTPEELEIFAMWHILPTNDFEQLTHLSGYDRQEWLRKFWKERDPTPTTDNNECLNEFKRRIAYAREHFSQTLDTEISKYLWDQHMNTSWAHAPWDAQGELYIKYGAPDSWGVAGYHKREWSYFRYSVDFIINEYMTNIYGKAIRPGFLSRKLHRNNPMYVESNYIYNQEFRYHHNYFADPIKDTEFGIEENNNGKVLFSYSVPTKEFVITLKDGKYELEYTETYVIFDEDLREVKRHDKTRLITKDTLNDFKKDKLIVQYLNETLSPGDYDLALRIEDKNSDKIGIFRIELNVKK